MNATLREKIEQIVKDAIKSRMVDEGIYDVVNLSFNDMVFDFESDIGGMRDYDAIKCKRIAEYEFFKIIGALRNAARIIDGAFE
ncbi:MAG: hypothetical protein WCR46_01260 [Deltaproteobacteria bacterium]